MKRAITIIFVILLGLSMIGMFFPTFVTGGF